MMYQRIASGKTRNQNIPKTNTPDLHGYPGGLATIDVIYRPNGEFETKNCLNNKYLARFRLVDNDSFAWILGFY